MKKCVSVLLSLLLFLAMMPAGMVSVSAADVVYDITIAVTENYDEIAAEIVILNQRRAENGLKPLILDPQLTASAMQRAAECSVYFSHTRPDGKDCFTAMDSQFLWNSCGENIAIGHTNAEDVMLGWMNSPGHRANILTAGYVSVGLGCVVGADGCKSWVQLFSGSKGTSHTPSGTVLREDVPIRVKKDWLRVSIEADKEGLFLTGDTTSYRLWATNVEYDSSEALITSGYTIASNSTCIRVDSKKKIFTAVSEGSATITATFGSGSNRLTATTAMDIRNRVPLTYRWEADGSLTLSWEKTHADDVLLCEQDIWWDGKVDEYVIGNQTSLTLRNLEPDLPYVITIMESTKTYALSEVVNVSTVSSGHVYDDEGDMVCNDCGFVRVIPLLEFAFEGDSAVITGVTDKTVERVEIPASILGRPVTVIERSAFSGCGALVEVVFPDTIQEIRAYAFYKCTALTSFTIPDGVTVIPEATFCGCTALRSVTIPKSVTRIDAYAFGRCPALVSVYYAGNEQDRAAIEIDYDGEADSTNDVLRRVPWSYNGSHGVVGTTGDCTYRIEDGHLTIMGNGAMADYEGDITNAPWGTKITSLTIEEGVTYIGANAFAGCAGLTEVVLPDSVITIGNGAFNGCTSLQAVTLGNGLTSIGARAFCYDEALTTVVIPDSVTTIGSSAFWHCVNLQSLTIGKGVTTIGSAAFGVCRALTSVVIPQGVTCLEGDTFYTCNNLKTITLPVGVTYIGDWAFAGVTLTDVYYSGTETDRSHMRLGVYNTCFGTATWHYGYVYEQETLLGDVNNDGKVNNRDLGLLQKYLNGFSVLINTKATDLDGNGKVNNRDLGGLQQLLNQ